MHAQEPRLNWRSHGSLTGAITTAPPHPGIYAFGRRDSVLGLPENFEWAYIGRSDQLQNRLRSHLPHVERNVGLRSWLLKHINNIEVWFATMTAQESRSLEASLVRRLNPIHNRIRFSKEK